VVSRRESVAISVKDTGLGIDPVLLPKVFDFFAQAELPPTVPEGVHALPAITRRCATLLGPV
jgi:K+-sensing histidine kinase KdpD